MIKNAKLLLKALKINFTRYFKKWIFYNLILRTVTQYLNGFIVVSCPLYRRWIPSNFKSFISENKDTRKGTKLAKTDQIPQIWKSPLLDPSAQGKEKKSEKFKQGFYFSSIKGQKTTRNGAYVKYSLLCIFVSSAPLCIICHRTSSNDTIPQKIY